MMSFKIVRSAVLKLKPMSVGQKYNTATSLDTFTYEREDTINDAAKASFCQTIIFFE